MIDLTIVCINKNSGEYIGQSIKSFLSQDYENFEILILDSNSTDNSTEIIKSFSSNKIKLINLGEKVNHHNAYLKGIENVNTEFITFMTSTDGYIDNEWFTKSIQKLKNDDSLSYVYANSIARDAKSNLTFINQPFSQNNQIPAKEDFLPFYLATQYHVNELNCVWSTKVVKKLIEKIDVKNLDVITFDLFEYLEFSANYEGYLGEYINTVANYGRIHQNSLTQMNQTINLEKVKKRQNLHNNRRVKIFEKLRSDEMCFYNRNYQKISQVNKINFSNFYIIYYFYKLLYPPYKIEKPLYSSFYIFNKFKSYLLNPIFKLILNKIPELLKKNSFFQKTIK